MWKWKGITQLGRQLKTSSGKQFHGFYCLESPRNISWRFKALQRGAFRAFASMREMIPLSQELCKIRLIDGTKLSAFVQMEYAIQ